MNIENKKIVVLYSLIVIALFLYSFTQVDLSLTLSRFSIWQQIEKSFQQIGYFNRPLSTALFACIIFLLCAFYLFFLKLVNQKKINHKTIWTTIGITTAILLFSYNAFSYDIFNYIFDAKILTHYNQNPYYHKALDFPADPMLSFMRWTHRTYPYGPVWLGLTVPLSILGVQLFLPTEILFKSLMAACYLGSVFFVGRILRKISPKDELFGVTFFALNPLVLIESLVSAHNDIVMVFFALWAFYMLIQSKYFRAFFLFLFSVGIKFATGFLFPLFAIVLILQENKKKIQWESIVLLGIMLMAIGVVVASARTVFQPWYLLYVLPFAALISRKQYVLLPAVIISFLSLFQYAPYLYLGNWDPPVPSILFKLLVASVIISVGAVFYVYLTPKFSKKEK